MNYEVTRAEVILLKQAKYPVETRGEKYFTNRAGFEYLKVLPAMSQTWNPTEVK